MMSAVSERLGERELQVPQTEERLIHPRIKIGVFVGASGSGKTHTIAEVRRCIPNSRNMLSVTTREERLGIDQPGEYEYVREARFRRMASREEFLWHITPEEGHGNWYGTRKVDVDAALEAQEPTFMHMTPKYVRRLHEYVEDQMVLFFLYVKDEKVLEQRLRNRDPGKPDEYYARRITDCRSWYDDAKKSNLPYIFIDNGGKFEDTINQVMYKLAHPWMFERT